jgi:phosphoribosylformylglycinamidine cyclo-ligase
MQKQITYKDSGVDVKAGEALVDSIKGIVKETHNSSVLANIGGFGGLFRPDFTSMKDPVLVSSVDGVGTKLIVAFKNGTYDTVGQDLVNHCVNDIAVCGAEPLFFLDYFSTGKLQQHIAFDVIKGFTIACKENGCALVGGETAEMPDIYKEGEFDLAGTIVGAVDRESIIDGSRVQKGDIMWGVPSTGLHTNGYSLARNVLFNNFDVHDRPSELNGESIGEALLKVHRSYLPVIRGLKSIQGVNAFSHITGGGIEGNTKRVLHGGLSMEVDYSAWKRPVLFELIQNLGNVPEEDMRLSMNLGIGLVIIASPSATTEMLRWAENNGEELLRIGKIV